MQKVAKDCKMSGNKNPSPSWAGLAPRFVGAVQLPTLLGMSDGFGPRSSCPRLWSNLVKMHSVTHVQIAKQHSSLPTGDEHCSSPLPLPAMEWSWNLRNVASWRHILHVTFYLSILHLFWHSDWRLFWHSIWHSVATHQAIYLAREIPS